MGAEAQLGASSLPWIPAYLGLSDTRGSIKRLTRSPARFTSVSWKMAEGLGAGGSLPGQTEHP